jgi:hypothetical protein
MKYLSRFVKQTLVKSIEARDDLMLTIKLVHDKEMELWCYTKEQYYDAFYSGNLSNVHTIRRIWQFVQEKNPDLRGKDWIERQKQGGLISQEIAVEKSCHQLYLW